MKGTGSIILYIGARDSGKTSQCKKVIALTGKPKKYFDFRGEYGGAKDYDFDIFIQSCIDLWNHDIVIEEATVFLSNRGDDARVKHVIAGASHNNSNVHILYHSIRSVPTYIMDMCNYYYLFKTGDNVAGIQSKFRGMDDILNDFKKVRDYKNPKPCRCPSSLKKPHTIEKHFRICRNHL